MTAPVRLLVVDDSEVFAAALVAAAAKEPRLEVVGVARDGLDAVEKVRRLRPDVVSMDVHMPVLDGVEAVARIMEETPVPIAVVTGADSGELAGISFRAIGAGALDVLGKPADAAETRALLARLVLLAGVRVARRPRPRRAAAPAPSEATPPAVPAGGDAGPPPPSSLPGPAAIAVAPGAVQAVAIAVSTGGPPLLEAAFRALPADYPVPLLVVQHLSPGFDAHLVEWLQRSTAVRVRLAAAGTRTEPGTAYLAPCDQHLELGMGGYLRLDPRGERVSGHRPSGTVLLRSVARVLGARGAGLVLTGMGDDGAEGLLALRRAGGLTGAQDGATSSVDGMPKSARDLGAAAYVVPAPAVATFLLRAVGR